MGLIYIRHEIVHNKEVVQSLRKIGAFFVEVAKFLINLDLLFSLLTVFQNLLKEAENYKWNY